MDVSGTVDRPLVLNELQIRNFRCFTELTINFEPDLTVLVARNGAGKTSILDAAAIALGTVFVRIKGQDLKPPSFEVTDVRTSESPSGLTEEPHYPVEIVANGFFDQKSATWTRGKDSSTGKTLFSKALTAVEFGQGFEYAGNDQQKVLPLVCHYGTRRLHHEENETLSKRRGSRLEAYVRSLSGSSSYRQVCAWMVSLVTDNNPNYSKYLDAIYEATASMLKPMGVDQVDFSLYIRNFRARIGGVWLSADQLSDGTRNLLALTVDLSWRCVLLNEGLGAEAVRQTPGVILIDEIDMHLHPGWQQTVLEDLLRTFPNMQFVVTTHSPQVVGSVDQRHLRILKENSIEETGIETSGATSGAIIDAIFGVGDRAPTERGLAIQHLKTVVSTGDFADPTERKEAIESLQKVRESTPLGEDSEVDLAEIELNWKLEG